MLLVPKATLKKGFSERMIVLLLATRATPSPSSASEIIGAPKVVSEEIPASTRIDLAMTRFFPRETERPIIISFPERPKGLLS